MVATVLALAAGLLAGLAAGGRTAQVRRQRLRWWTLLAGGAALTVIAGRLDSDTAVGLHLAGTAALAVFAAANVHLVGVTVVLVGLALNAVVIAVHGGMPVRPGALVDAGLVEPAELADIELTGPRHLAGPGERLSALGDAVPLRPLRRAVSIGDLIVLVGLSDVAFHLSRRRGRHGVSDPAAFWRAPPRNCVGSSRSAGPPNAIAVGSGSERAGQSGVETTAARPAQDWGAAPRPVPSSGSQCSASPDRPAPRTSLAARSRAASNEPERRAATHSR